MKAEYYVHSHRQTFTATTSVAGEDGYHDHYEHKKVTALRGEHVMSYRVFKTLKLKDVVMLLGPLARDVK